MSPTFNTSSVHHGAYSFQVMPISDQQFSKFCADSQTDRHTHKRRQKQYLLAACAQLKNYALWWWPEVHESWLHLTLKWPRKLCTYYSNLGSNFPMRRLSNFVFDMVVQILNIYVVFDFQGHGVNFNVTAAKKRLHAHTNLCSHQALQVLQQPTVVILQPVNVNQS